MPRWTIIKRIAQVLFPSVRAYVNFMLMWTFVGITGTNTNDKVLTLVAGFATLYFLNEWSKATGV